MSDDLEVNVPLLRKAVEWAESEAAKPALDRRWVQGGWRTPADEVAYEIAEDVAYEEDAARVRALADLLEPHCGTAFCIAGYVAQMYDARYAESDDVDDVHASELAARELGIDLGGASSGLFWGGNTIEDVRSIAEELAGERL